MNAGSGFLFHSELLPLNFQLVSISYDRTVGPDRSGYRGTFELFPDCACARGRCLNTSEGAASTIIFFTAIII